MSDFTANWSFPTAIRFGPGRIAELSAACREAGLTKPLLVTDPGLAALPMISDAMAALEASGLQPALYTDLRPNPVAANVEHGVAGYREGGHDGVIVMGGGSAMDVGKCIAFMAGQTRPMWDFEDIGDWWTRADPDGIAPVIAVPTTSGTGSEVGRAAVITNSETQTKKVIFHPKMLPVIVIADPELTVGLPPGLTAGTGMDAFAHCLEAYCAPGFHPMAEGIAVEGMRLVADYLPRAYADGGDLAARSGMMAAAAMGAVAFQKGLGGIHALSHPIGALYDTPHGLTNAVVMPYMLRRNRPAIEQKITRLAAWLGLEDPSFEGFLAYVITLREELSIPPTIEALGIKTRDEFDNLAEKSLVDPTAGGNPVPLTKDLALETLEDAFSGRL
ncbi:MAG: iron-containing alcohol dehydrogenase [Pseudomonadota bacterium]